MTKPMTDTKTKNRGAAHGVTKLPLPAGTGSALALDVAMTRAIDQELGWYFSYAEGAMLREDLAILPSYAAERVLASSPSDPYVRAKAAELVRVVQGCLGAVRAPHASVLRVAYTPRKWPPTVRNEFGAVAGVAVRLTVGEDLWPARGARSGLDQAAAARLAGILTGAPRPPFSRLKARAEALLGRAVVAYWAARSQGGLSLAL